MKKVTCSIVVAVFCALLLSVISATASDLPSTTGEPIHLSMASTGDSIPVFLINEPEHGILPPECATVNPITLHQPDVDFDAFYATHAVNGPSDLWPTTE